jgi:hypothetical protein
LEKQQFIVRCHGSGSSLKDSHCRGPGSILWPVHVGCVYTEWHWNRFLGDCFIFHRSTLLYKCVKLIFIFKDTLIKRIKVRNMRAFSFESRESIKEENYWHMLRTRTFN